MSDSFVLAAALLAVLGGVFVAIGIHLALDRAYRLLDGHLERLQGKLDVLVSVQAQNNTKLDAILRKLL